MIRYALRINIKSGILSDFLFGDTKKELPMYWKVNRLKGVEIRDRGNFFDLHEVMSFLSDFKISGISGVHRTVINHKKDGTYELLVDGYGLRKVLNTQKALSTSNDWQPTQTSTNHLDEIRQILGIEAAQACLVREIDNIMQAYGIGLDRRHIDMLGETMTRHGEILGINRFGIAKMRASTLMLASFEKTGDHLFDAASFNRSDPIDGVSESIILGKQVKLGTGAFDLYYEFPPLIPRFDRKFLFENPF